MWQLAYSYNFSESIEPALDNSDNITQKVNRVMYEFILESEKHGTQVIATEFDSFSEDVKALGLPESNVDVEVQNMFVRTHNGVLQDPGQGHLLLSKYDYSPFLSAKPELGTVGAYGCMQLWSGEDVLWAINHINHDTPDFGIGNNNTSPFRDWTFSNNATDYTKKVLNVYVV